MREWTLVGIVAAVGLGFVFLTLGPSSSGANSDGSAEVERSETSVDRFGISRSQYAVKEGRVERAETVSDLLATYGVDYQTVYDLLESVRPTFEAADVRAGNPYRVYVNPWLGSPQFFVYEITPTRYIVFDLLQPERSRVETRTVRRQWETVEGTINGSLYKTLVDEGGHPLLALRLSEVFAWQIDFFRIRRGDQFRVVFERRSVDGENLQPGDVVAAYVEHLGKEYYAFRFDTGEGAEYFNREGESLRRQLLKAPLKYSRISSRFTNRRFHPVLKQYRPHHGTDYAAPRGTPVRAVGSGVVQFAGYRGPNGNYVKIRHNGTYTSGYLHLSDIASGVHPGATVDQGETIGYVGSTGRSTGPHLDYRLWKRGTAVDPYELELPPSQPVPIQYRDEFRQRMEALLPRLEERSVFAGLQPDASTGENQS